MEIERGTRRSASFFRYGSAARKRNAMSLPDRAKGTGGAVLPESAKERFISKTDHTG
jgi:hypothetical protein